MSKRRLVLFPLLAFSLLVACLWVTWPSPPGDVINRRAYEQIHEGLTRAEVDELVGLPPGDYTAHKNAPGGFRSSPGVPPPLWWASDEGCLVVWFDADGLVISKDWQPFGVGRPFPRNPVRDWVRRLLGL